MNKITLLTIVGLFFAVGSVQAHCGKCGMGDGPKAETMEKKMDMMKADLGLSTEQQAQVEAIMKDKMEKKQAIMEDKKKAMDALHDEFKTKLKAVLSDEQMKKWEAMKDDMHAEMGPMCPICMKHKKEGAEAQAPAAESHDHDHK